MAMLGDIIASAHRSAADVETWLGVADPHLFRRAGIAAEAEGMSIASFVRRAAADFDYFATDEDWATLVSHLRESSAPGKTCLIAMLEWRLAAIGSQSIKKETQDG
jgi:hypothetical protein